MGGKSSGPSSDPRVGEAALQQAATGQQLADLGQQQFDLSREQTQKFAPIYEQLLNQTLAESQKNAGRADAQWDQYLKVFQPLENKFAAEAANYATPAEQNRREALAAATVGQQFDATQGQMARNMARMGVSPTSSLGTQAATDLANSEALAKAGAVNQERNNTKTMGLNLLQQAAALGRGQTSTGLAASNQAVQGAGAGSNILGSQTQQGLAGAQAAGSLISAGGSQMGAAANTLLNQWTTQVNAAQSADAGFGGLLGTLGGAAISKWSSKTLKEGGKPVDDDAALAGLEKVPVESWKYKDGVDDGGRHEGPYAEDMHAQFGDEVAPGGVQLDMVSVSGKHHAAIRALAKRVRRLEKDAGGLMDTVAPRDTEPHDDGDATGAGAMAPELRGDIGAGALGLMRI